MSIPNHDDLSLQNEFLTALDALEQLERQAATMYKKFEKTASSPELSKCLSPESTGCGSHLKRLKLIKTTFPAQLQTDKAGVFSPVYTKKKSGRKDLQIVCTALQIQNQKLAFYEFLHPLAVATGKEIEAELLAQTINELRDTNTWLRQLVQNVIAS